MECCLGPENPQIFAQADRNLWQPRCWKMYIVLYYVLSFIKMFASCPGDCYAVIYLTLCTSYTKRWLAMICIIESHYVKALLGFTRAKAHVVSLVVGPHTKQLLGCSWNCILWYVRVEQKVHERGFLCVGLWVYSIYVMNSLGYKNMFFLPKFWRKIM